MGEANRRDNATKEAMAALFQRGVEAMRRGQHGEAEIAFRRLWHIHLVRSDPDFIVAGMLGQCLLERARDGATGLLPSAAEWLAQSYHINPDPSVGIQLADAYQRMGMNREARELFTAIGQRSDEDGHAKPLIARTMLAGIDAADGRGDLIARMTELADADLTDAYAIDLRGFARKWLGRWADGWADRAKRFEVPGHPPSRALPPAIPYLTADMDLSGKTVCLWTEQGYGDLAFMSLWLKTLHARYPTTTFWLKGTPGHHDLITALGAPFAHYTPETVVDAQCSILDVPHLLGPAEPPLAPCDPMREEDGPLCVKLTGLRSNFNDHDRSCHDATAKAYLWRHMPEDTIDLDIAPLAESWSWGQTVATIRTAKALITVDTAVANIAAVIGTPCYLIPPTLPEYRWGTHPTTVPWAPSVSLIRRRKRDDWPWAFHHALRSLGLA